MSPTRKSIVRTCFYIVCTGNVVTADGYRIEPLGPETWDAFADLLAGRLVDRTMTRWGKFRPFIMFGAVPLLFMSFLVFHVPSSFDAGMKIIYAYATYAILGLVYSLVNIPYGSLASAITQSVHERA